MNTPQTITFTSKPDGNWRCAARMSVHDVILAGDLTPEMFEDQKRRFEQRGFNIQVVDLFRHARVTNGFQDPAPSQAA